MLEGATLGGQLIVRHLRKVFANVSEHNFHFFNIYGDKTGLKWRQFQNVLIEYVMVMLNSEQAIIESAIETFIKLQKWLEDDINA